MRKLTIALLLSLFAFAPRIRAFVGIATDASSSGNTASATSLTVSHTITGSDTILFVSMTSGNSNGAFTMTYNAVSMTSAGVVSNTGGGYKTQLFYLINPATGTHNIVGTLGSGSNLICLAAESYTGAKQSGVPEQTAATNNASNGTATTTATAVTTVADNAWVVSAVGGSAVTGATAGSGTTQRATTNVAFGNTSLMDGQAAITPAGSKTINANYTTSANWVQQVVVSFAPISSSFLPGIINSPIIRKINYVP